MSFVFNLAGTLLEINIYIYVYWYFTKECIPVLGNIPSSPYGWYNAVPLLCGQFSIEFSQNAPHSSPISARYGV